MAQQEAINIKVTVDSKDAQQGVDKLQQGVKQTGEAAKKAEAGAKKAGGAFASIGNALKSLGIIGLVVRGFEFLQEILMKNQKVADAFAIAGEFISRVLSDLVEFVVNNFGKVVDLFTKVFNDPMKYVKELGEAIKNNLIERVKSLIDAYGFLGEIIKNVFTGEFDKAAEAAKNFGKEVVDVFTGVDDAFDKGVEVVKNATAAIVDYGKETLEAAKKGVALRNSAKLAASEAERQAAIFKRQAEEQRQIRDNEFASIQDRIEANQRLGKILADQLKSELKAAELAVASAQYEKDKNNNLDNQIALNQALAALESKREEITGQRSEQLVNEVALRKELLDINKQQTESDIKLDIEARKSSANRIKDEKVKLETLRQIAIDEAAIELQRLQDNIKTQQDATKQVYDQQEELAKQALANREITEKQFNEKLKEINQQRADADKETNAARVAAEIEYKEKKAAIAEEIIAIDENIEMEKFKRNTESLEKTINNQNLEFEFRRQAIELEQEQLQEALNNKLISEQDYTNKYQELVNRRMQIDAEEVAAQQALQDQKNALVLAGLDILNAAAGQNEKIANVIFAIQKAIEIGRIITSTASAIAQVQAGVAAVPAILPPGVPNPAFAAALALGIKKTVALKIGAAAQLAQIAAASISKFKNGNAQTPSGTGGQGGGISTAAPIQPQLALPTVTQLDNQTINRMGSATNRAYVLESDINNNQERLIRITRAARLG